MKNHFGQAKWWGIFVLPFFFYSPLQGQTVDKFMGVNTRAEDPIARMKAVGMVREYHDWLLNEGFPNSMPSSPPYPNNEYKWNPNYRTYIRFDDFYSEIANNDMLISPATINSIPQVVSPFLTESDPNAPAILAGKPIPFGADPTLPSSYISHAAYLYHYAARYGSTTFSPARQTSFITARLASNEVSLTGLGVVDFLENWNEPDLNNNFTAEEFAAMYSADYDGHAQTMGLMPDPDNPGQMISTVGVKNADPNMTVVMGGLEKSDLNYIRDMVTWFKANRPANATFGQIPLDVINIHRYLGNNPDFTLSTQGVSPEEGDLQTFLETFTTYRDSLMPSTKLWLSEFGYDTNENSNISVPVIGTQSPYEVQAQWIIRTYMAAMAAGFDRAIMFDLRDACTGAGCPLFTSAGLLESQALDYKPKESWYYTYTMKNVLTGMTFDADLTSCGDLSCPRVYRFIDPNNSNKRIYAVWSPTSADISYPFNLALEGANAATLVEMGVPSIKGLTSPLTGFNPTIMVSERPVFVIVGDNTYTSAPSCTSNFSISNETCSTLKLNWDAPNGVEKFQIWYMEGDQSIEDFNRTDATLVTDEVDATLLEYTLSGLPIDTDFTFFLIPEGAIIDPDNPNAPTPCVFEGTTLGEDDTADDCRIPIDPNWIFDPQISLANATNLFDEQAGLDPFCQPDLQPSTFWGADFPSNQAIEQERLGIDLQAYYFIDAIAPFDGGGIGVLEIEKADSPNGPWTPLVEYQTLKTFEWAYITNFLPSNEPVRYLRFTASEDDMVQIGELFLCGRLSNFDPDIPPGIVRNATPIANSCNTVQLEVLAPFDNDIDKYKVTFGGNEQFFDFTGETQTITIADLQADNNYSFSVITVDNIGQESTPFVVTGNTLPAVDCEVNCNPSCPTQLCLKTSWITDLTPEKPLNYFPTRLVDEQANAPVCGNNNTPFSEWGAEFDPFDAVPPVYAQLDLQAAYNLDSIFLFDGNSAGNFTVDYLDENGVWQEFITYSTDAFNQWVLFEHPTIHTRYLRLGKLDIFASINEVVIHASPYIPIDPPSNEISNYIASDITCTGANLSWDLAVNTTITQQNLKVTTTTNIQETILPANTNTFTINNLQAETVYDFALSTMVNTEIADHQVITIQTPSLVSCGLDNPPNPVANFQITNIDCDELTLSWQPPVDNDLAYYTITVQPGNLDFSFSHLCDPSAFTIPNLQADINYQVNIKVFDQSNQASTTQTVSGTTLKANQCGGNIQSGNCNAACPTYICIEDEWITDLSPSPLLNPKHLFDEADKGNLICGVTGTPITKWGEDYLPGQGFPPIIATVDLQQDYLLDGVHLFDVESEGNFRVEYQDSNGNWVEIVTYYTDWYNKWMAYDNLNITTRYLRFTKLLNPAKVGEVALFGVPVSN